MTARLVIDVTYDSATTTKEYVKDQLTMAAEHLANNGMLSGDGSCTVDIWHYKVEVNDIS